MRQAVVLFVILFFAAMPARAAEDRLIDRFPVLADTLHVEHTSPLLGRPLQAFIKKPALAPDHNEPLPVIYLLDADQAFPLLASYSWALTFSEEMPPAVLVGIGYGSTAPNVNFRGTDYTVPSPTREIAGGAETFLKVIEQEIIPLAEGTAGIEASHRILLGQSLGGHFVLYQAIARPGLFDLGIAINPAIHHSPDWFTQALADVPTPAEKPALYISSADNDVPRFADPGRAFIRSLAERDVLPWCLRAEMLEDHMHLTSMPRAFRNGLRWFTQANRTCSQIDPALID